MLPNKSILIIGPAYPLRGGLASFNERMAKAFTANGYHTSIVTFSLQYPNFLFPGTTQYSTDPKPKDLDITVAINSINPFNWYKVGKALQKQKPTIVIVRYWMPFVAPALGTILRSIKKNKHTKIICIADNIIPHEQKFIDKPFTQYFVKPIDAFVTMSEKVMTDLRKFTTTKAIQIVHPLYDNFGEAVPQIQAQQHLQLSTTKKTMLFFGFIRHYKGLDILLEALYMLKQTNTNLYHNLQVVIAGEYYEDAKKYTDLITKYELHNCVIEKTNFIPDSEVKYYLCAADVVIQPYRNATQSGVTPLAYHYNKPMIVTNVGALANNVPHGIVGLVCQPNATDIAATITTFFNTNTNIYIENIKEEKKKYSWDNLVNSIVNLCNDN